MRRLLLLILSLSVAGCAMLAENAVDKRFGPETPTRFDHPPVAVAGAPSYDREVRPLLERRCVVCHGCYDAPCQLKLTAWEGVARGATKAPVYDATRLDDAPTTRLFIDAQTPSQWREKGFYSVLNERDPSPANNLAASVLYRSLALKKAHPLPDEKVLSSAFDFSLDRSQSCPRLAEYDGYERDHPLGGMPYGLPGLNERELDVITRWLAAGSPTDAPAPLPAGVQRQVNEWERFLNGDSLKAQLMSRYLYEHLYLGHLVLEDGAQRHNMRLIRSAAAPGQPPLPVATRRPYDDPGVSRVYYRLVPEQETILAKTHMPYRLTPARMAQLRGWFLDAPYTVSALPSYAEEPSSNPFVTFADIPVESRYRFLLDEAEFFIMNFIKGPVCRGQMALDVIEDQFWVFFVDPAKGADAAITEDLVRRAELFRLPGYYGSDAGAIGPWLTLKDNEDTVLKLKAKMLNERFGGAKQLDLSMIWDGEGRNPNAALTVFRHFNSASVVQGLVGEAPKTAWVIGYPLLERIYYLLVAGYDPYGNVGHQLLSRLFMDFMRMEGESNFLALLPKDARKPLRDYWYRGASARIKEWVDGSQDALSFEPAITYRSNDPQRELYGMLTARLAPALNPRFGLDQVRDPALRQSLQQLAAVRGVSLSWLPEATVLRVDDAPNPPRYFSLLRNTGHANVTHLASEAKELRPAENTLTVVPGFIGAYPNAIYRATPAELPALATQLAGLKSEPDYRAFADRFAVRRTSNQFWATSDALMDAYRQWDPQTAGLFDYGRLENR